MNTSAVIVLLVGLGRRGQ